MNRIKSLRLDAGMKQSDLAHQLKVTQTTISNWELGRTEPDYVSLQRIAQIFGTTVDHIMGGDPPEKRSEPKQPGAVRIPVLGSIQAGIPIEAIEDIVDWEEIPPSMCTGGREYFALKVRGDSMWPDIVEGDVVILRKSPSCDNGDICAVYVNGSDATLKQVKLLESGELQLIPRNPAYPSKAYSKIQVETIPITLAGVVVELRRKMK